MSKAVWTVKAYTAWNTEHSWEVDDWDTAREYAKRMVTEGLWLRPDPDLRDEVFLPVHQIVKVKISSNQIREG